jgi:hypothetical protein
MYSKLSGEHLTNSYHVLGDAQYDSDPEPWPGHQEAELGGAGQGTARP